MNHSFTEQEVSFQSSIVLKGTVCVPKHQGPFPAILIIPGTGKIDRNGKVNKKLNLRLYEQLAVFLSSMGFVTLRYDKRGVGESGGSYLETGLWDLVDDAQAAIHFLRALPEVDENKIIVLGHSEGSTIGTAVAVREQLSGLILLSGAVERITEALERQREIARLDILNAKGLIGSLLRLLRVHHKIEKQAQKFIQKVVESKGDTMRAGLTKVNAKWMREHFAYNVREDLKKVDCPVLAITGALDMQANPKVLVDLPHYVKGDNEHFVIENMGHSCKFQSTPSTMLTIKKDLAAEAVLPLHPRLVDIMQTWLNYRFTAGQNDLSEHIETRLGG